MADKDVDDDVVVTLLRNSSMDDLRFELKRLQQKYDVLERDKKILEDEREIATKSVSDSNAFEQLSTELKAKNAELLKWYESASAMGQKHRVVLRHLWLEKRALREMKAELSRGVSSIFSSPETISALQHMTVQLAALEEERRSTAIALEQSRDKNAKTSGLLAQFLTKWKQEMEAHRRSERGMRDELCQWTAYVADVQRAMGEAVSQAARGHADTARKLSQLEGDYDKLKIKYDAGRIEVNAHIKKIDDLKDELRLTGQRGEAQLSALKSTNSTLESKQQSLQESNRTLLDEKMIISTKLEESISQTQRLASIYEGTQQDLQAALQRENDLKSELSMNGSSKEEISSRLKRIQDKVNNMEVEHADQIKKLQVEIEKSDKEHLAVVRQKDIRIKDLQDSVNLTAAQHENEVETLKSRCNSLEERLDYSVVNDRDIKLKCTEQENLINSLKSRVAELELREDDTTRFKEQTQTELAQKEELYQQVLRERSDLEGEVKELQGKLSDQPKGELDAAKAENARLLMVVQKECQERTELIIQISELKDFIRDNSISNGRPEHGSLLKAGSTAYSQISAVGGLSQEKISSGLVSSHSDDVTSSSEKRLAEAINYSRKIDSNGPASGPDDDAWAQRIGRQGAGRGRKPSSNRTRR